jgi:hypothetical protein
MSAILRKSSFFYITHLCTFVIPPLFMLAESRNRAMLSVMALWIPVWLSSSVLWSERQESYAFLRMLPVTDRQIVRSKLGLALGFAFIYWLLLALLVRWAWGSTPEYAGYMALVNLTCSLALVLAAGWYVFAWRFGRAALAAGVMASVAIVILATWAVDVKSLIRTGGIGTLVPRRLAEGFWTYQAGWIVLALAAFFGLSRLAVRVKERSETSI